MPDSVPSAQSAPSSASLHPAPPSVLVIGAGMAGLACARALDRGGLSVTVVDKGRGPGGRMSTRRHETGTFDHGAQFFTARDPDFQSTVTAWAEAGLVAPWPERLVRLVDGVAEPADDTPRWVGVPRMSAVTAHLASDLRVLTGRRVIGFERCDGRRRAQLDDGSFLPADLCLITAPAPQTADLLDGHALGDRLRTVEIDPCIAAMVDFASPVAVDFDAARPKDSPLSWIARDSSKPGRPGGERWVLHASPLWSREHIDADPASLAQPMLQALADALEPLGHGLPTVSSCRVHRWRYAQVTRPLGVDHLFDPADGLGYAGDGGLGSRVGNAYRSGVSLAQAVLRSMQPTLASASP